MPWGCHASKLHFFDIVMCCSGCGAARYPVTVAQALLPPEQPGHKVFATEIKGKRQFREQKTFGEERLLETNVLFFF